MSSAPSSSSVELTSMNNNDNKVVVTVVDISIGGMTCSMCSSAIQKLLDGMDGIKKSNVNLATNTARIEYVDGHVCVNADNIILSAQTIADEIECIGYDVNDIIYVSKNNNNKSKDKKDKKSKENKLKKVELAVGGMTCSMCSSAVTKAVSELPGVESVDVSLSTNIATVHYYDCNPNNIDDEEPPYNYPEDIKELIEDIGYDVNDVIMSSTNTAAYHDYDSDDDNYEDDDNDNNSNNNNTTEEENRLERILKQQDLQLKKRKTAFLWAFAGTVPITTITMIIPRIFNEDSSIRRFLNTEVHFLSYTLMVQAIILWILTTPVQFGCGYTFYKTSWHGIRRRVLGMDVLVSIGTTSSYLYAFMCMFGDHDSHDQGYRFFETSAVLITFVLLGKWMNAAAVRQTSQALTQLMKMQPKTAIKVVPCASILTKKKSLDMWNPYDGDPYSETIVSITKIKPNDIVKVLRGSNVPADGIVLYGEMTVDQSMITGESIPVHKVQGDDVLGGTICSEASSTASFSSNNGDNNKSSTSSGGTFVKVTGVGSDSALSQIVAMVQDAQSKQVPIQNYADSIASIFVPSVVCFSILTFLTWYACCSLGIVPTHWYMIAHDDNSTEETSGSPVAFSLLFGIAALVISCPCALGLATPTAVMVGTGVGARHGILMKGGETLESGSKVNVVVFDKTGTLTKGKPAVTDFHRLKSSTSTEELLQNLMDRNLSPTACTKMKNGVDDYLVWLLGSLERNSEHILASAIVRFAEKSLTTTINNDNENNNNIKSKNNTNVLEILPLAQPTDFVPVTGRGASGKIHNGDVTVAIGNRPYIESLCSSGTLDNNALIDAEASSSSTLSEEAESCIRSLESEGKTAVLASVNGTVCAVLGIADEIKEESSSTINYLRYKMNIDVWMVTGDSKRTAHAVAKQLDLPIERVIAEALPITKVQHIRKLQKDSISKSDQSQLEIVDGSIINDDDDNDDFVESTEKKNRKKTIVCMVGDGINDSPALVEADVGVSMGTGSDIAAEASDMVLVGGNVQGVCTALDLSRTIFRRIQFNLFFSMVYNIVGIPIAAGVLYPLFHTRLPPTLAALAMALSSISVVASSLALRLYRPPDIIMNDGAADAVNNNNRLNNVVGVLPGRRLLLEHKNKQKYDKVRLVSDSDDDDTNIDVKNTNDEYFEDELV